MDVKVTNPLFLLVEWQATLQIQSPGSYVIVSTWGGQLTSNTDGLLTFRSYSDSIKVPAGEAIALSLSVVGNECPTVLSACVRGRGQPGPTTSAGLKTSPSIISSTSSTTSTNAQHPPAIVMNRRGNITDLRRIISSRQHDALVNPWALCPQCRRLYNDGICDLDCNVAACLYDGGDCGGGLPICPATAFCGPRHADDVCDLTCVSGACGFDGGDCTINAHTGGAGQANGSANASQPHGALTPSFPSYTLRLFLLYDIALFLPTTVRVLAMELSRTLDAVVRPNTANVTAVQPDDVADADVLALTLDLAVQPMCTVHCPALAVDAAAQLNAFIADASFQRRFAHVALRVEAPPPATPHGAKHLTVAAWVIATALVTLLAAVVAVCMLKAGRGRRRGKRKFRDAAGESANEERLELQEDGMWMQWNSRGWRWRQKSARNGTSAAAEDEASAPLLDGSASDDDNDNDNGNERDETGRAADGAAPRDSDEDAWQWVRASAAANGTSLDKDDVDGNDDRLDSAATGSTATAELPTLALTTAICLADIDCARALLNCDATVTVLDHSGRTALHWAAACNVAAIVADLVHAGADVNVRDMRGATPLYLAAREDNVEAVQQLLAITACRHDLADAQGLLPADVAPVGGRVDATGLLARSLSHCTAQSSETASQLSSSPAASGMSPSSPMAKPDKPADPADASDTGVARGNSSVSGDGCSVSHSQALGTPESPSHRTTPPSQLREARLHAEAEVARVFPTLAPKGVNGQTVLHTAAASGNVEQLQKELLAFEGRVRRFVCAATPSRVLRRALKRGLLLRAVNVPEDADRASPLHCAARGGHHACLAPLLAHGARTRATDIFGRSALHWAAACNDVDAVTTLLAAGSDVALRDERGSTPLALALRNRAHAAMRVLVANYPAPASRGGALAGGNSAAAQLAHVKECIAQAREVDDKIAYDILTQTGKAGGPL